MGKKRIFQNIRIYLNKHRPHVNRKYRDRLFCALFGQDKEALLQLYNALHGTAYTDSAQLTVVTLDNIIYMKMVNDLAFVIAGVLNLYEHQSTYNPNMPLRFLLYIAEEYDEIIRRQDANIYGSKLVMLPAPQCVVFYNGDRETEDEELLRLSDCFQNREVAADLELTVHLRNINLGHNEALMRQCHKLWEYASLVSRVNENLASGMTRNMAVEEAVTYCLEQGILTDFLDENRTGVLGMLRLLTEYNEKEHIRRLKRDAKEDGRMEGMLRERAAAILELLSERGDVSAELRKVIVEQTDIAVLREWCRIAASSEEIEDFERQIHVLQQEV